MSMNKKDEHSMSKKIIKEIAVACKKTDGFGMIIEVHSEDHGILGDKTNPAHAHIKSSSEEYLGKFEITQQAPRFVNHIINIDKNIQIPIKYKEKIIKWASSKNEDDILYWFFLKSLWKALHP